MGGFRQWFKVSTDLIVSMRFQRLTNEEAGILFRLLGYVWRDSPDQFSIPNNREDLSNLLRVSSDSLEKALSKLMDGDDPILVKESGRLVIPLLRNQAKKNEVSLRQRQEASRSRWERSTASKIRTVSGPECEPECEPVSGPVSRIKQSKAEKRREEQRKQEKRRDEKKKEEGEDRNRGGGTDRGVSKGGKISDPKKGVSSATSADSSPKSDVFGDPLPIDGIPPVRRREYPNCPISEIIDCYRKTLVPPLPEPSRGESLEKHIRQRWRAVKERQSLEWWENYFEYVSGCPYLMGQVKSWKANLLWLVGPKNMDKVLNGQYLPNELIDKYGSVGLQNMRVAASLIKKMREKDKKGDKAK